jgi:hypothetical protein
MERDHLRDPDLKAKLLKYSCPWYLIKHYQCVTNVYGGAEVSNHALLISAPDGDE